jgi:endonuclease/exonuclease/phosphatase family metal-dependent hydrolase
MKLVVILILIALESGAQILPINQARKLRAGTIVTVTGRITASGEFGDLSFVQDPTGGIPVYSAIVAGAVARGDSIVVTGKLSRFNGLLEILSDSVRKTAAAPKQITPKALELPLVKDHEGELVRIAGVLLKPEEHFFYPQRSGLMIKGNDTLHYWIDGDTNIPGYSIPAAPVFVTGVVGRFKDQYQVLPRSVEDIPGIVAPIVTRNANTIGIMNWNMEFFGAARESYNSEYGPPDEALQTANAGRLLNAVHPDIIAVQEISDDNAFKELVKIMPGYEGRCSSRFSYSFDTSEDFPPQKLCFLYRVNTVRVIREKVMFRKLYDDAVSSQSSLLATAPGGAAGVFASGRLPYLLEAEVTNNGFTKRVFVVNIHAKSGATAGDHARRGFDAQILKDTLDAFYAGRNVVLLGDLNDDLDISIAGGRESPYAMFIGDKNYMTISKKLSDENWHSTISYDDMIDHQLVSASMADSYVVGSTTVINPFGLVKKYGTTTSDHLPVLSEFDFRNDQVTGVDKGWRGVFVYPNPVSAKLGITCQGKFEYRIMTSLGICIQNGAGFDRIDTEVLVNHSPGIYTVLISANNRVSVLRVIKQ